MLASKIVSITLISFGLLFIGKASNLLSRLIIARLISPTDFGLFSVMIALISLTSMCSIMGMHQGIVRYYPIFKKKDNQALNGMFLYPIILTVLSGAIIAAILLLAKISGSADPAKEIITSTYLIGLFAIPGQGLLVLLSYTLLAQGRSLLFLVSSQVLFNVFFLGGLGIAYFIKLDSNALNSLLLFYVSITWVSVIAVGVLSFRRFWIQNGLDSLRINAPSKEFYWFSLTVLGSSVSYIALTSLDKIVMGFMISPSQIALYSVAFTIAASIPTIMIVADAHASPRLSKAFAENNVAYAAEIYQRSNEFLLYVSSPIVVILVIFNSVALGLFGTSYTAAEKILVVLIGAEYFNVILGTSGRMLQLGGRAKSDAAVVIMAVFLNLVLNLVLIRYFGILGAVFAVLITRLFLSGAKAVLIYFYWNIAPYSIDRLWIKLSVFSFGIYFIFFFTS